jgi:hypothetical protein
VAGEILDPRTDLRACAMVLRHLKSNEVAWRQRVGDEDFDNTIRSWQECLARLRHLDDGQDEGQGN